jgi:hypothetical protein
VPGLFLGRDGVSLVVVEVVLSIRRAVRICTVAVSPFGRSSDSFQFLYFHGDADVVSCY